MRAAGQQAKRNEESYQCKRVEKLQEKIIPHPTHNGNSNANQNDPRSNKDSYSRTPLVREGHGLPAPAERNEVGLVHDCFNCRSN
jgi:hypothetical protein